MSTLASGRSGSGSGKGDKFRGQKPEESGPIYAVFLLFFFGFFLPQKGKITERVEIDLKGRQRPTDGPTKGPDDR